MQTTLLNKKGTQAIGILLYLVAVILSYLLSQAKYLSLNYHTRDYAFYLQFAEKLLDANSAHFYTVNPIGNNWLLFSGMEGAGNFYQSIHFEPIKYVYAAFCLLTKTPSILFLFVSLVFFAPILYLVFFFPSRSNLDRCLILAVCVLYIVFPSALLTTAFDLRPYIFLIPFSFLFATSIAFSRPLWEKILWLNCLFLAREEAIIIGACGILFAFFGTTGLSLRKKTLLILSANWLVWCGVILAYFDWTNYPTRLIHGPDNILGAATGLLSQNRWALGPAVVFSLLILTGLVILGKRLWGREEYSPHTAIFAYLALPLILAYQFVHSPPGDPLSNLVFEPRYMLHFGTILGLVVPVWLTYRKTNSRLTIATLALLGLGFVATSIVSPRGFPNSLMGNIRDETNASDVLALRRSTEKYGTWIITDFATYQAFYDYEHVYIFQRLPAQIVVGDEQSYPDNMDMLVKLLNNETDYIVISRENQVYIDSLIHRGNLAVTTLFENDRFIALKILR